ncbi:MAG: DNA mismatch repair protein MutS [Tepidisphaeraceae bacterium]
MSDELPTPGRMPEPDDPSLTPAMRQYVQFKRQHPDYTLFFRMGDFYEMFWDDAKLAHRVLGVTLTSRNKDSANPTPMAGVPFHAVESYLRKMIAAGHRVAICEQQEEASGAKTIIRREVTRLMTPGTLTDENLLDGRTDNYLAALAFGIGRGESYKTALAWIDLSTGTCVAMSDNESRVLDELGRLAPAEVLVPEQQSGHVHPITAAVQTRGIKTVTQRPGWQFTAHHAKEQIAHHWGAKTIEGFGFAPDDPAAFAIGAVLSYLQETQKSLVQHLRPPRKHVADDHLSIDPATYRALEIDKTVRSGGTDGSLLSAIDRTRTGMGARLLRQWVRFPLTDLEHITARQSAISTLLNSPVDLKAVAGELDNVCDIERIVARLSVNRASPRDVAGLGRCLDALPRLIDRLAALPEPAAVSPEFAVMRDFVTQQAAYIKSAILPDPAPHLREGGAIAAGFDAELDRLRTIGEGGQQWLAEFQAKLVNSSGIPNVKVGYNRVFGYYIELSEAQRDKAPPEWTRKQTLKGAERYITPELKAFENDALGARDRAIALEQKLFEQVRITLLPWTEQFQELASSLARLDVLCGLANLAIERKYCRPTVTEERLLHITDGRHPVLEQQLGNQFVGNDLKIAADETLLLITGPNMAGKSTYIRQAALLTLLAQIGSYVPAKNATIGICDRLFARIGASDEIHSGQSTFMVEMTETANLLNNATARSLVILDEIGRGTSTLDGLSLAWAISEHLASQTKSRTLFATHYHELTDLAERYAGIRNLNVAVREWDDNVVFLHRIVEGGTDRSYGIHVARLAGVPAGVLERAKELLSQLAVHHVQHTKAAKQVKSRDPWQMYLFDGGSSELLNALKGVEVDALTPMAAFDLLRQWKEKFGK